MWGPQSVEPVEPLSARWSDELTMAKLRSKRGPFRSIPVDFRYLGASLSLIATHMHRADTLGQLPHFGAVILQISRVQYNLTMRPRMD